MQLPVLRTVEYLSPTSISEFLRCQMLFYLKRMSEHPYPTEMQGRAAAVGSCFDSIVKAYLAKRLGQDSEETSEEYLIEKSVQNKDPEVLHYGRDLANKYISWKIADRLIDEGLAEINFKGNETFKFTFGDVPLLGYPDGRFSNGSLVDWKINGAFSKSGVSPTQGYRRRWIDGILNDAPHPMATAPFETIHPEWARQQAFYSLFSFGYVPGSKIPVAIEQGSIRNNKVTFSSIRSFISADFMDQCVQLAVAIWKRVQEGEIDDAEPSPARCNMYGQLCAVAGNCKAYQSRFGESADPTFRSIMQ